MAPILSFTAEEAWTLLGKAPGDSIFFHTWNDLLPPQADEAALVAKWARLREIRAIVTKRIEESRASGALGSSLQAEVELSAPAADLAALESLGDDLRFALITSKATLVRGAVDDVQVHVRVSPHAKCERCWHYRPDVGTVAGHATICARCASNLEGPGEVRRHA
jgi:isoleucyl-tRNA synthetase